jgi:hypothetical protein
MSQRAQRTAVPGEADVLALEVVIRLIVLKTVLLLLLQRQLFLLLFFLLGGIKFLEDIQTKKLET